MSQSLEKQKTLLQELFQLDQPDLEPGLYRVMRAKSAEVSHFLDEGLLPQARMASANTIAPQPVRWLGETPLPLPRPRRGLARRPQR